MQSFAQQNRFPASAAAVILALTAALFAVPAVSAQTPAPAAGSIFPDAPAKPIFMKTCSSCHDPENVIGKNETADEWGETINKMIQNGATGSDDDFGAILDYLTTNFGPAPDKIDVNKATVLNLRNWLSLSQKQADAVVAYRTQNGNFKSLDDLKKVPGIDPKLLDARKDHLAFAS